ncbi:MAG: hypothetical protein GY851_34675 [bacterium]|nr:hypothetical protein [bacterium]
MPADKLTDKRFRLIGLLVCLALAPAVAHAATPADEVSPQFLKVVPVDAAPAVDGALDDVCWQQAGVAEGFFRHKTTEPAPRATTLRMCYDRKALYVAVDCGDETADQRVTERMQRDDPGMWRDSGIELFLIPNPLWPQLLMVPPEEQHVHLILNAKGVQYDQLGTQASGAWSGNWSSAVSETETGWTAEIAIPFTMMETIAPDTLTLWKAQIARNAGGPREAMTWTPSEAIYREHKRFGALVFVPDAAFSGNLERESVMHLRVRPAMERVAGTMARLAELKAAVSSEARVKNDIDEVEAQWAAFNSELTALDDAAFLSSWESRLETLARLDEQAQDAAQDVLDAILTGQDTALALYPYPAMTDTWITPASLPDMDGLSRPVEAQACPGEFESATFVAYSPAALSKVTISVDAPMCGDQRLPEDAVDVRVVKCWYQEAPTSIGGGDKVLLPELLLKNPDLVPVDYDAGKNLVKRQSLWSHPDDAATLHPFSMPARFAQQIWLTVRPPKDAAPGLYVSKITVASKEGITATIPLHIEVLDFSLEPSLLDHGLYNVNNRWGTQDEARVLAEMRNLADHGIMYMMARDGYEHYGRIVRLMKEAGLHTDRFFSLSCRLHVNRETGEIDPIEEFKEEVRNHLKAAKDAGAGEVYVYMIDEATGETLRNERAYAKAVRELGGKTAVACNSAYFENAGDFIDAPIVASAPMTREQVAAIHAVGARVYCYANPQCGLELPETYRRNYGLLLWQADYDGSMDFAWYWPFNDIWNDFDHPSYKDHNMVYPTKNGVIDTIQWEGWREAADDCRYMATLLKAIDDAGDTAAAQRAKEWVENLKNGGGESLRDLDGVRAAMIAHIRACRQ